ncbi:MAG: ABC transporter substrate-binding protein [Bacteroidales bacterium]|jgi:iron complex transport system substrate-binding protein|nr:ABC transporter substrate-binding protein [Bacteroidales bacterium]
MKRSVFNALFILLFLTVSCGGGKDKKITAGSDSDDEQVFRAERFSLVKNDSCTILTIYDPWQGTEGIRHIYYLVEKGNKSPCAATPESVIYIPVERIICMSTTHLAMIAALGKEDAITGFSGGEYVFNKYIYEKVREGLISDVGYEAGLNSELIIKIAPDLIMMYGIGNESAGYIGKIKELGIKVMFNADYLETDPLGKAEWIKLFGALFCMEAKADSIFTSVSDSYDRVKEFVKSNTDNKPGVLMGLPFRDTWFISPGNSYISKLISDAGGNYLWQDTRSNVSMPYNLENVYIEALKADFWLNIGSVSSKKEISSFDLRLENIPCFSNGNLYNNNKRVSSSGGNDYWESGALNPHLILQDIASILHPGLFDDYELIYYRKIE